MNSAASLGLLGWLEMKPFLKTNDYKSSFIRDDG